MAKRRQTRLRKLILLLPLLASLAHCGSKESTPVDSYSLPPAFERTFTITEGADTLQPVRLQFFKDTLYVSYNRRNQIDLFTPALDRVRSVRLESPEAVFPTSFAVADSEIFVCDHAKRAIVVYNHGGTYQTSFGMMPDEVTPISPLAVTYYGGVLYTADIARRRVLAISMTDAPGITERGELILTIPADSAQTIGFPSAVAVTPDGRLLAGDAEGGVVRVYTCDGRAVYTFDSVTANRTMTPLGFATDGVFDPSLEDSSSFDPSGIRRMGRIHVVDANNAIVHMFNPVGRFVSSYPQGGILIRPSGIAIDPKSKRIYIADPAAKQILIYTYQGQRHG